MSAMGVASSVLAAALPLAQDLALREGLAEVGFAFRRLEPTQIGVDLAEQRVRGKQILLSEERFELGGGLPGAAGMKQGVAVPGLSREVVRVDLDAAAVKIEALFEAPVLQQPDRRTADGRGPSAAPTARARRYAVWASVHRHCACRTAAIDICASGRSGLIATAWLA